MGGDNLVPGILSGSLSALPYRADAGIVDQNVYSAEPSHYLVHYLVYTVHTGNVHLHCYSFVALLRKLISQTLCQVFRTTAHYNSSTFSGITSGDNPADTLGRTRND